MTYLTRIILSLLLILAISFAMPAYANKNSTIVVVVHKNNPVEKMNRSQVIDLFMGKHVAFPNGDKASPIDIQGNKKIKQDFYHSLIGQSLARVNAYWSRIKFTGRAKPLLEKSDCQAVAKYISDNKNAIGYISKSKLNDNLKVVYQFDDKK